MRVYWNSFLGDIADNLRFLLILKLGFLFFGLTFVPYYLLVDSVTTLFRVYETIQVNYNLS